MDGLEDRIRRNYGTDHERSTDGSDVDALLHRVHSGAQRRRQRRRAAIAGAAGVAAVVVAGGVAVGVYGLFDGGAGTTTALQQDARSDGAGAAKENAQPESRDDAGSGGDSSDGDSSGGDDAASAEEGAGTMADEAGGGVPEGFEPATLTAISPGTFWVLGEADDEPVLARTDDGGESFTTLNVPPLEQAPRSADTAVDSRPTVRFADARNGWLFAGGDLYATQTGGQAWTSVEGLAGADVTHLEAAGGYAFALAVERSGDGEAWSLWRSRIGGNDWTRLDAALTNPTDLVVTDELVAVTDAGDARTSVVVSRDAGDSFEPAPTPCSAELSAGQLSATADALWLSCPTGMLANVAVSTDAGQSWDDVDVGEGPPPNSTLVGARDTDAAVVARPGELTRVQVSDSAEPVGINVLGQPSFIGFTTPEVGYVIDEAGLLLRTTDAGRTWQAVQVN